jgi:RNA polymerase sigma-70 factor, ECF subfamily
MELTLPQPFNGIASGRRTSRPARSGSAARQDDPDAALMLRVKRGDMQAFEALVERYKQPVTSFTLRIVNDPVEAEDLAQHVFVQVFKSARRYQPSARFSTWLFTIARNLCLNEIRRRTRHPALSLEAIETTEDGAPNASVPDTRRLEPGDAVLRLELERKVEAAVASLPEKQRTAVLLFTRDELSYEDIAEVLGCSLSATKSLIHRARETLKARLKPYVRDGAWEGDA